MNFRKLDEELKRFVEDYDSWLLNQADAYMDPDISEITISGYSFFDIKAKNPEGKIVTMENIPLTVYANLDVTYEDENTGKVYPVKWDDIADDLESYFDFNDLDNFDTLVEELPESACLPEDYELEEVLGFADGHSFDDLTIE